MIELPNHTRVPNTIIDEWMRKLTPAQFKVIVAICRKTFGWQKRRDAISISQFQDMTGLSNKAVISACKYLEERGLVRSYKEDHKSTKYEIAYDLSSQEDDGGSELSSSAYEVSSQEGSELSTHTKETFKETKTKESNIPSVEEVISYFTENGYSQEAAKKMWGYYNASVDGTSKRYWRDSRGNMVRSWKQKAQSVWFKDENKMEESTDIYSGVF